MTIPSVLVLDLEGTLISTAVSQFPRPGLRDFLCQSKTLFKRIAVMTAVDQPRFRAIARLLVAEGHAPAWFAEVEYIHWQGKTKDLRFVPQASVQEILLLDDLLEYVHPGQETQHVHIETFEPRNELDDGLSVVLGALLTRVRPGSLQVVSIEAFGGVNEEEFLAMNGLARKTSD